MNTSLRSSPKVLGSWLTFLVALCSIGNQNTGNEGRLTACTVGIGPG